MLFRSPDYLVKDRTILDFGSALGAMGHYALLNGAKHYTGIEIQKPYIEKSKELLSKYHTNWDIKETFDDKTYDIVLACGSIHGFFDIFGILRKLCSLSNQYVILETHNPNTDKQPMISFQEGRMVKNDGEEYKNYNGLETLPNKVAIDLIMLSNGFREDRRLFPKPILGSHDAYNVTGSSSRFISRYIKGEKLKTLEDEIWYGSLTNP